MQQIQGIWEDKALREELRALVSAGRIRPPLAPEMPPMQAAEVFEHDEAPPLPGGLEAIVLLLGRPALLVQNDTFALPESETWRARLDRSRDLIEAVLPSVGRLETRHHPRHAWLGTAWLIAEDVIATNRHVAIEFARGSDDGYSFRPNPVTEKVMQARIDFREEHQVAAESEYRVEEVLYIEPEDGPDLALLRLKEPVSDRKPIDLSGTPVVDRDIALVGYPAWDGRRNDPVEMQRIFKGTYDVKRLQPGRIRSVGETVLTHDSSSLGGSSGSPLIDLDSGKAVGLHFAGRYLRANYAVPSHVVANRFSRI